MEPLAQSRATRISKNSRTLTTAMKEISQQIQNGQTYLGIELGSTRIKALLLGSDYQVLASGSHSWESHIENGNWSYSLPEALSALRSAYQSLKNNIQKNYGCTLKRCKAIGISAMMHGYLAFDAKGQQLAEFRTWRNTNTSKAAAKLSELFAYNIPQRWSVAHLYQAVLNREEHLTQLAHMTTLAGYIHWQLTGEQKLGICDASGMFPIDPTQQDWNAQMLSQFDELLSPHRFPWKLKELLPRVLTAGKTAGRLSKEGAALLDPDLQPGILLCAPEGDAGTGMVATNSVAVRTGNISAGTSIFAMLVLEKPLSKMRREIDLVTTPDGLPVAMAHCNNGSSDIDAWIGLLGQAAEHLGARFGRDELFGKLYNIALKGDVDCNGLLHYGYVTGEDLVGLDQGCPLFMRAPSAPLDLANFMRSQLYSALCALKVGLNILFNEEGVKLDDIRGHGGFFKAGAVTQRIMAAALGVPVRVLAAEGGAISAEGGSLGIGLLAAYASKLTEKNQADGANGHLSLPEFLEPIFAPLMGRPTQPDRKDAEGFERYFARFIQGLAAERQAQCVTWEQ